jgi:hypothetical protein
MNLRACTMFDVRDPSVFRQKKNDIFVHRTFNIVHVFTPLSILSKNR